MTQKEKIERFLNELSELTKRHGIAIHGCGCCGSPWIEDIETGASFDHLTYCEGKQKYEIDMEE